MMCVVLKRLKSVTFPEYFLEELKTFTMSGRPRCFSCSHPDNPKMTDVVIPEGCFPKSRYFSLQGSSSQRSVRCVDLPALTTIDIADGVMAHGGFCIMRSRWIGCGSS